MAIRQSDVTEEDSEIKLEHSRLLSEEKNIEDTLRRSAGICQSHGTILNMRLPGLSMTDREYLSSDKNFAENEWSIKEEFTTIDNKTGTIEFFYLKGFPLGDKDFNPKNEEELLANLANLITRFSEYY